MGRPKGSKNGVRTFVELECAQCGTSFQVRPYRAETARYCSRSCTARARMLGPDNPKREPGSNAGARNPRWKGGPVTLKCQYCGRGFQVNPGKADQRKTCSRNCAWQLRRKNLGITGPTKRSSYSTHCKVCGKKLTRDQKTYCSWNCAGKDLRKGEKRTCPICGKTQYVKRALLDQWTTCSQECLWEWKRRTGVMAGENNPAWRGGYQKYYGPNWQQQRRRARKRDGYRCRMCGAPEDGQEHDVHHIIAFREFGYLPGENDNYKMANRLSNLVTLCRGCHRAVENGVELKLAN